VDRYSMNHCSGYEHAYTERFYDARQEKAYTGALTGTGIPAAVVAFLAVR
jgi:hypothetical protein